MAYTNPYIKAPGTVPYLGSRIKVHWPYLVALLVGIATVHLLLLVGSMYFSRLGPEKTQNIGDTTGTELHAV